MLFSLNMATATFAALLLLVAMAAQGIHVMTFVVTNSVPDSDDGKRFDSE